MEVVSEELYRSPGCHYTTPISSHGVGEVDEESFMCSILMLIILMLYFKRLG